METHAERGRSRALLVLSRGAHPGVDDAISRMKNDGTLRSGGRIDFGSEEARAPSWAELERTIRIERIEYVVLHHFHSTSLPDPSKFMRAVRGQEHRPVVGFSGGDSFFNGFFRPSHPKIFKSASAAADVVFNTSMGKTADVIQGYGAERVSLLPLGACQVRFPLPERLYQPSKAEYDVCFIGSNNRSRHPGHSYFWYSRQREKLVKQLYQRFGERLAVFGAGWGGLPANRGPIPFHEQLNACRSARVVVGGVPYSPARYYMSNRPFVQIMSGVPFVDMAVEGVDAILRDGEHWHLAKSLGDVADRVDEVLARSDSERVEMGYEAARYVAQNHTQEHRWRSLVATLESLRSSIVSGSKFATPNLDFLLPEAKTRPEEVALATRGW